MFPITRTFSSLLFVLISNLAFAQDETSKWMEGANTIVPIYERLADPYLRRFAQNAYPPGTDGKLIDAQYRIYKQRGEELANDLKKAIKEEMGVFEGEDSRQQLITTLSFIYRNNFPGLDYNFFEKATAEAGSNR